MSHTTITRHQEEKQSNATSSLFHIEIIVKLKWTQSNAQQSREQLQNPTMGVTINNESTTTGPPPYNGQQSKPLGSLLEFYWYQIFALVKSLLHHVIYRNFGCKKESYSNLIIKITTFNKLIETTILSI